MGDKWFDPSGVDVDAYPDRAFKTTREPSMTAGRKSGVDHEWTCGCYMANGDLIACRQHSPYKTEDMMSTDNFLTMRVSLDGTVKVYRGHYKSGARPIRQFPTAEQANQYIRTAHHQKAFTTSSGRRVSLR